MKSIFKGVGVALITPFINDKIDYKSTQKIIEHCIKNGADSIVALGTTGEGSTISFSERKEFIKFSKQIIDGRCKLIVGSGNNNFETCYKNTFLAKSLGADGVLVVTPYYNKTTQNGLVEYYQRLSEIQIPIIMYNVPSRTGLNIELDTVTKIIQTNPWVYGIKESTADITRIIKLHSICKDKIAIYSGEDFLNYVFYCLGASGTISVTANAYCSKVKEVFSLISKNDYIQSLKSQQQLSQINELLFCETNPIPIKFLMKEKKLISSEDVRFPLIPLSEQNKNKIKSYIEEDYENN